MFLAGFALILGPGIAPVEAWTSCEEVYAVLEHNQQWYAGTSGGVLVLSQEGKWSFTSETLNRPIYHLERKGSRLVAEGPFGAFTWDGEKWREVSGDGKGRGVPDTMATSAVVQWDREGGQVIDLRTGKSIGRPGTGQIYCVSRLSEGLAAGTSDGLWMHKEGDWARMELPSLSPMPRLHGMAQAGSRGWVAGGISGLMVGRPGQWERLNDRPVRRIHRHGLDVWVVYGDGTVDKLSPQSDLWQHDVLYGSAKRPWASLVATGTDGLLIGGQGGWIEKTSNRQIEARPEWLDGDVVTAMTVWKGALVVAGQKTGLHVQKGSKWMHFNAAHGLVDLWITGVLVQGNRLWIATATEGLFSTDGQTIRREESPAAKLTGLALFKGDLILGSMDGAFRQRNGGWVAMGARAETTSLVPLEGELWVLTPFAAQRFSSSN